MYHVESISYHFLPTQVATFHPFHGGFFIFFFFDPNFSLLRLVYPSFLKSNFHAIPLMADIPFPTTWDGAETLQLMGKTTNLNWLAGFQPSTVGYLFFSCWLKHLKTSKVLMLSKSFEKFQAMFFNNGTRCFSDFFCSNQHGNSSKP